MELDASARELLHRATCFALQRKAAEVDIDHLWMAAKVPGEPPALRGEIAYSEAIHHILSMAHTAAEEQAAPFTTREHILRPFQMSPSPDLKLGELLQADIRHLLSSRGVDTEALWPQLGTLSLRECRPSLNFPATEAGRRCQKIAWDNGNRQHCAQLVYLLMCLLAETPASQILRQARLTEEFLVDTIRSQSGRERPAVVIDEDILQLPGAHRLTSESLGCLQFAWQFSPRTQLQPEDLLPRLLPTYCSQAAQILERLDALDFLAVIPSRVFMFGDPGPKPCLSPEMVRVLEIATQAAGGGLVETGHLLLGVAESGHPLVAHLAEQIRELLFRG